MFSDVHCALYVVRRSACVVCCVVFDVCCFCKQFKACFCSLSFVVVFGVVCVA